ncbi:head decoration protein [Salinarimonas rosea]|uniref:head decoration protein n=1 Tax=Salinarimonas rosea TaxID=552063 RepID=UPI0003F5DC34|nr:head decoration protein [Salinarimonas rosea]
MVGTYTPQGSAQDFQPHDHRFADTSDVIRDFVTISSGQNLAAGSVLGKVTATGEYVLSLAAANDGSEVPVYVLAEPVNASAADAQGIVYARAHLLASFLVYGAGHSLATVKEPLRDKGINVSVGAW